uniref:Uncharacterized protein n=1 Tax=Meloidogyne incognita TaxID=6306 RepID=A0A914MLJ2_MELIC
MTIKIDNKTAWKNRIGYGPPCRGPPCRDHLVAGPPRRKLSFAFYFKAGLNFARHVPYFIPRLQRLEIRELISVSSDWRFSCSHF